jgi:AcrR family transcriptional regulator
MEKTKKSSRKTSAGDGLEKIKSAYQEYLLIQGKRPASVYKFCLDLGIKEEVFYSQVASFDALERLIWKEYIDTTIQRLEADPSFAEFRVREKILAFYFTLLELLKQHRSFILFQLSEHRRLEITPFFLKDFKTSFEEFFGKILASGKGTGEVAERPYLDKRYPQLFWGHMSFVLLFWKDDDSAGFEKTDAFIEKSVNLAFDLIGKGALDSAIDFAKFLYQTKMR